MNSITSGFFLRGIALFGIGATFVLVSRNISKDVAETRHVRRRGEDFLALMSTALRAPVLIHRSTVSLEIFRISATSWIVTQPLGTRGEAFASEDETELADRLHIMPTSVGLLYSVHSSWLPCCITLPGLVDNAALRP